MPVLSDAFFARHAWCLRYCLATVSGVRRSPSPEEGRGCESPAFDKLRRHPMARRQALQGSPCQQPLQVSCPVRIIASECRVRSLFCGSLVVYALSMLNDFMFGHVYGGF